MVSLSTLAQEQIISFIKTEIIQQSYQFFLILFVMINDSEIASNSKMPIYEQVIKLIKSDIELGILKKGEKIPSINETSSEYAIARDTVEKAYKKLREEGIIESVPGKGYFVSKTSVGEIFKVCLLFNKLSNYKKETYDSFIKVLDKKATVDLFIYNFNIKLFEKIITNHLNEYDFFVIIPHFLHGSVGLEEIVKKIPKEKVLIIDKKINSLINDYPTVYQDFEEDIVEALEKGIDLLRKYKRINLLYPEYRNFSKEILMGFKQFCNTYRFEYKIIDKIEEEQILLHEAYVIISDDDLVSVIKQTRNKNFKLGTEVGVISYNDSPMKEILENGITTISTHHEIIGEMAAKMLLSRSKGKIKIPFTFNKRNSL